MNAYFREWQGTSVNFEYNVYSVDGTDAEALKRDGRDFALPALAAKRMLEAEGKARKRGEYSEEGKKEGKFEVARSMLADGLPAETVRKYTGLDESSILSLKY
ncbi:MAG: hypothetical protein LBO82_07080 [Synergistaceae bacterium]|nr:hypothetical protein [Synergistaceae bacterium]